jgi:hypothetical protein
MISQKVGIDSSVRIGRSILTAATGPAARLSACASDDRAASVRCGPGDRRLE